jgi:riboflavin transporter FmnP
MVVGVISMVIVGALLNAYVLLPAYAFFMEMEVADFVAMGTAVNSAITNIETLIILAVVPFNLFKGIIVSLIVYLIYKKVSPLLKADDMYDGESCDL